MPVPSWVERDPPEEQPSDWNSTFGVARECRNCRRLYSVWGRCGSESCDNIVPLKYKEFNKWLVETGTSEGPKKKEDMSVFISWSYHRSNVRDRIRQQEDEERREEEEKRRKEEEEREKRRLRNMWK
ncbi:hypothetical protein B0T19DRAFT_441853 [Cercophora scortea]|uniref:Uncharacterized protein n=1 Tax=Cercophora scortea TaxID=314031 RepID=A0AAE0IMW4_9PEZI|nr:hypothetical protein B0T19DRAFT_441853 [Cercophora scortea]